MKRIWGICLLSIVFSSQCFRSGSVNRSLEAESAALSDGMQIKKNGKASGGRYIHMPRDRGKAVFDLELDSTARYAVHIRYRAWDGDRAQHLRVNGREYAPEIGFSMSPEWSDKRHAAGLIRGHNRIELDASWGNMDIDYIRVEGPVKDAPDLSPVQNFRYTESQDTDLSVRLDKNHNAFTGITCSGQPVPFTYEYAGYLEDACQIHIPNDFLETLDTGRHSFLFHFKDMAGLPFILNVMDRPEACSLSLVSFNVDHGTSVLVLLPTGQLLLIDTGTEEMCRKRVIPFLDRHGLKPDFLWITHHHPDHEGGTGLLGKRFRDLEVRDNHDFGTGVPFMFEGVNVTMLNTCKDGNEEAGENSRSLSIRMEYQDFVYTHGGDIYGQNQRRILKTYRNRMDFLKTHVYHANHHFHSFVDVDYLNAADPVLILVSGEEHIYGRAAYTDQVQPLVIDHLKKHKKRLIEDLLSFETGHTVIRVNDGEDWTYETCTDLETNVPGLGRLNEIRF